MEIIHLDFSKTSDKVVMTWFSKHRMEIILIDWVHSQLESCTKDKSLGSSSNHYALWFSSRHKSLSIFINNLNEEIMLIKVQITKN